MKKTIALLSLSTFVFVGCNAGANAQNTTEAVVGNPGSSNSLTIERGYIFDSTNPQPNNMQNQNNQQNPTPNGAVIIEQERAVMTPDYQEIQDENAYFSGNN